MITQPRSAQNLSSAKISPWNVAISPIFSAKDLLLTGLLT
jgi:hypothetical protein